MKIILFILLVAGICFQLPAQDCTSNENVTRFMTRGKMALKNAENPEDYKLAADEFLKALEYDSKCPDIHYNLALCYEQTGKLDPGNYQEAINYLNTYLSLLPNATNKQEIQEKIYEMEFLFEQAGGVSLKDLIGKWKFYNGSGKENEYYDIEIYETENKDLYVRYIDELNIEKMYILKKRILNTYHWPDCIKCKKITTLFPNMENPDGWYIMKQDYRAAKIEYSNGVISFKTTPYIYWRAFGIDFDTMDSFNSTAETNIYQLKITNDKLHGSETCIRYKKCNSSGREEIKCPTDCDGDCGNNKVYFVKQ
jgi:tetratricopeptide (TPR) repeat protein